ncbi:MAG TPA: 50S ribosomal protein L9 [Gemmatimonadales bacterium]|nr:50S ribosomal protein L9 [Gemmatimonadales bacterium]
MIEVILRQDVSSLGRAGEMVRVRPGYARNYLLPKGLAYPATEGNKKRIAAETRALGVRLAAQRGDAERLAEALRDITLTLPGKVGEGDRLFGSVTAQDVADALASKGFDIDKRKVDLEHPIKTLGDHTVSIKLHPDVPAGVHVTVVPE